ncbi:MAG: EthD family reductase [Alphaproteobacteria bacterium]|nr:EthD family reductase [Alphaproteobacteria bacterium]
MIKVSVMFPYQEGGEFNMDYYLKNHIPLVQKCLGSACKGIFAEKGMMGGAPGTPPMFIAMGHIVCESPMSFQMAFLPHMSKIMGDIKNFTEIQPIIQMSSIKM